MPATRHGRMRLFSGPLSMFGAKTEIAALEKGLDFELVMVPFEEKYEPKHPEVLRINPKQQVPILIHGDLEIFDSTQIFEYFEDLQPEPPLWPQGPAARARARLLELKSDEVYFPHIIRLMGLQSSSQDPTATAARRAAARCYEEIDGFLADREFLTRTYSFADIAFYMAQLFGARMGAPMTDATPNLLRWRDRMTARPAVRSVVGPMAAFLLSRGRPVPDFLSSVLPQRPAADQPGASGVTLKVSISESRSDHTEGSVSVCVSAFGPRPGLWRPLASIEPGNQPRRAGAVRIVFATELRAQQRLFRAYAREERWDKQRREQHPDARTKHKGPPKRVDEQPQIARVADDADRCQS